MVVKEKQVLKAVHRLLMQGRKLFWGRDVK
jgi:hypothetical protein